MKYFHVLPCFTLLATPVMMFTPLQLPSVQHNRWLLNWRSMVTYWRGPHDLCNQTTSAICINLMQCVNWFLRLIIFWLSTGIHRVIWKGMVVHRWKWVEKPWHNPSCESVHMMLKRMRREFGRQNIAKKRLGVSRPLDKMCMSLFCTAQVKLHLWFLTLKFQNCHSKLVNFP